MSLRIYDVVIGLNNRQYQYVKQSNKPQTIVTTVAPTETITISDIISVLNAESEQLSGHIRYQENNIDNSGYMLTISNAIIQYDNTNTVNGQIQLSKNTSLETNNAVTRIVLDNVKFQDTTASSPSTYIVPNMFEITENNNKLQYVTTIIIDQGTQDIMLDNTFTNNDSVLCIGLMGNITANFVNDDDIFQNCSKLQQLVFSPNSVKSGEAIDNKLHIETTSTENDTLKLNTNDPITVIDKSIIDSNNSYNLSLELTPILSSQTQTPLGQQIDLWWNNDKSQSHGTVITQYLQSKQQH